MILGGGKSKSDHEGEKIKKDGIRYYVTNHIA